MNPSSETTVLILGLGASGLAMARWCAGQGARVRVWDSRAAPPQAAALADVAGAQFFSGTLTPAALDGIACVYKSPGLSPLDARLVPLLDAARAARVPVRGELDLFADALAGLKAERGYAPKVIAITGTNGKTTTTALTGQLVERAGRRVAVAGNIGPTMLDTLSAALAEQAAADAEAADKARADAVADAQTEAAAASARADAAESARAVQAIIDEMAHAGSLDESPVDARQGVATGADRHAAADGDPTVEGEPTADAEPTTDAETTTDGETSADGEPTGQAESDAPSAPPATLADDDAPAIALIPPPPPEPVFSHLPQVWVLELSSFQLDGVQDFAPSAAAVLNVTQDHLDWHGTMDAYASAKARIYGQGPQAQTVLVINRDDPIVEAMVPPPVVIKPVARGQRSKTVARRVVRFGLDAPRAPGDFGLVTENGMAWLVRAMELDPTLKRKAGDVDEIVIQRLMPADALRIRGRHNAANALAALALASAVGVPLAPMLHGLRDYRGEPHRVEPVGMIGNIEFFDDSKGTNVGATVAALNGLGADRAPAKLVVILGGDGKGQDFAPLAGPLRQHARAAATIGQDAEAIEAVLQPLGVPFRRHASLEDATRWALAQAGPTDAVLLSPACASLDMFRDYKHRADVFVDTMRALAEDAGEIV